MARLNDPPAPAAESVDAREIALRNWSHSGTNESDAVKRRFLRQNRDLAK